jgi:hypothetical protein
MTNNAHDTGEYVITTYRDGGEITFLEVDIDKNETSMREGENSTKSGTYLRDGKEICLSDHPAGDWYFHLNDGRLDVGPFISREAAIADARESIKAEAFDGRLRTVDGRVRSVNLMQ